MKQVPTPSDSSASLRARRDALIGDRSVRGRAFGAALASAVDETLRGSLAGAGADDIAIVAMGSYARGELCPGSDIDVLLLLPDKRGRGRRKQDPRQLAERLWYPLWDAGFVTGHGARSIKESLALAQEDFDAYTALLDVRHVAGAAALTDDLRARMLAVARREAKTVLAKLEQGVALRRFKPGLIAEMLEPNLKDGGGGLRDVQALDWAATALGASLVDADERPRIEAGRSLLLDVRVALHRSTGGRRDLLALQEHDGVAQELDYGDADALVRELASTTRTVARITSDAFARRHTGSDAPPTVDVAPGTTLDARQALELAGDAARREARIGPGALQALRDLEPPTWDAAMRAAFIELLRNGTRAVAVFESLDDVGALTRIVPEWEHVRSFPQRNAYHRFTVDRHLLEAVSECATLLDLLEHPTKQRPLEGLVVRALRRPELLLMGAWLHDIGKGLPGDHSDVGSAIARSITKRMGFDSEAVEIVEFLVRNHLLMAETATRRDLSDEAAVRKFCASLAFDGERLRLLYLLTIGDSLATGPAAWNNAKAALVRDLFVKAAAIVERDSADAVADERRRDLIGRIGTAATREFLARLPLSYQLAFDSDVMAMHHELLVAGGVGIGIGDEGRGHVTVTIVAPDRPGVLATVAGALTCCGLAVHEAVLFTTTDGVVLDVFRADDTFGRFASDGDARVRDTIERGLDGRLDVAAGVEQRRNQYLRPGTQPGPTVVAVDLDASEHATVVEVHADDQVGLLFRVARAIAALGLDVTRAKVATLGARVVDTFYVRDMEGAKVVTPERLDELEAHIRRAT